LKTAAKYRVKKVKLRGCEICKTKFLPSTSFVKWCSPACGYELAKRKLEKKKKEELKEWNKYKKSKEEKLKTLSDFKADLEDEVNHIVRLIDKGHECISSGAKFYQVNAGHMYSVGAFPALRFHLLNIYNQSVHDNMHKGGNGVIYKERVKEVFGLEISEEIESLKRIYKELHMSIPEAKEAIKTARKIKRELIKETSDLEKPFTTEQRIERRRYYNQVLNIYK
jgi:hypothetical protein